MTLDVPLAAEVLVGLVRTSRAKVTPPVVVSMVDSVLRQDEMLLDAIPVSEYELPEALIVRLSVLVSVKLCVKFSDPPPPLTDKLLIAV